MSLIHVITKIRTILLLMTWILALGFNLPYFFSSIVREDGQARCSQKENTFMFIYSMVDFTFDYCVPLGLISALYYKIMNSLRTPGPGDSMRRHNQNRKVRKIVMSMVAASFVCWTPHWVLKFIEIDEADFLLEDNCLTLRTLTNLFPLLSTVMNPVILFLFSTNYRSALRTMFTSCSLSQCKCSRGSLAPQHKRELKLPGTATVESLSQSQAHSNNSCSAWQCEKQTSFN